MGPNPCHLGRLKRPPALGKFVNRRATLGDSCDKLMTMCDTRSTTLPTLCSDPALRSAPWWARGDLNPHILSDTGT